MRDDVEVEQQQRDLWFERSEQGLGVRPASWKGRTTLMAWLLLVVIALLTYSALGITVFVVLFYTAVLVAIVALKSDLLDEYRTRGE